MSPLGKYVALGNATFQQRLAQRRVVYMSLAGQVMGLLSLYFVWKVLFASRGGMGGFTWPQMQTYLLLTFCANAVLGFHSELMMSGRILDGSVAIDLLKPLDYQTARFTEIVATALIEGSCAIVIAIVTGVALGCVILPADPAHGALAFVSFALGVWIKFGVVYIAGLVCFWTTNGWGISWAQIAVSQLFSGGLAPLPLLPAWLGVVASWLPFQGMIYTPITIFLGRPDVAMSVRMMVFQVAWGFGLWFLARAFGGVMMRRVTIHGG